MVSLDAAHLVPVQEGDDKSVVGAKQQDRQSRFSLMIINRNTFCCGFGNVITGNCPVRPLFVDTGRHYATYQDRVFTIDGSIFTVSPGTTFGAETTAVCLFYGWSSATASRIWSYSHSKANGQKVNLLPVRIGNTGYMYDTVSGQLFGNTGTGDFILGPDI